MDTKPNGDTMQEIYSLVMELFFGWHVLLSNFANQIESSTNPNDSEAKIKNLQRNQRGHLNAFKKKVEETLCIKLIDNKLPGELGEFFESSESNDFEVAGLKAGEDIKMALKIAGTHIYVWKKGIDCAVDSTQTDEGNQVGDLNEFKKACLNLPRTHEGMIDEVRVEMSTVFDKVLGDIGSENKTC